MRKQKKFLATLFLASIVCFSLTACEAKKSSDESITANTNVSAGTPSASKESLSSAAERTTPSVSKESVSSETPNNSPAAESSTTSSSSAEPQVTAESLTSNAVQPTPAPQTSAAVQTAPSGIVPANSNIVSRTDGLALNAEASMTYPIINVGSEPLNAAINHDIVAQNTALLQQYAASYSDVRLNFQTAFLDSKNVVYTSYYIDYTKPGASSSNTFMFTRIYDLKRGGAAVRVTDLTYSARELAQALLTQNLDTYRNTSLDPGLWEAQKSVILTQSEDALTDQLEKADFGSNHPSATIFTRKPADGLMTIYYPVGEALDDYAAFTVKIYE